MTTGDEKARDEYSRLVREVQLANMRETHRLLTSALHQKAPAVAAGVMIVLAALVIGTLIRAAALHVGL